ncbi:hypothetical protein [Helicobacter sp.]|uniref:hypothetical protein n=1 Tax=Helicobacter sp. TaxID=218 RepID=UPI0025C3B805|nr:hypothetical protein [Helicobacter sp.]MCI5969027.1 hypothetical protein [Helicobacter sp.]MDY2585323.1 hypothetical protein [Helicobacter sp.]
MNKNHLYDYLLYLLNKYDENHFFDNNTNAQNERLLKITASKIKNAKKNISVQFMNDEEYENIFEQFIREIFHKNILRYSNGKIKITLENPSMQSMLESKLKVYAGEGFEYNLNRESVEVSVVAFMVMLDSTQNQLNDEKLKNKIQELIKEIKKKLHIEQSADLLQALLKAPKDFGVSLIDVIKTKINAAIKL